MASGGLAARCTSGDRKTTFDNFLVAAKRADNLGPNAYWNKPETLVKGHTHIWYMKGQMWLGTMNAHGYNDPSKVRGMHLMALNFATGKLVDHSKGQPGGVFHAGGGTYTLAVVPANDLMLSVGVPDCTIIAYNPATGAAARTAGVPHDSATDRSDPLTNGNSAGRDMAVLAGDKVLRNSIWGSWCGRAGDLTLSAPSRPPPPSLPVRVGGDEVRALRHQGPDHRAAPLHGGQPLVPVLRRDRGRDVCLRLRRCRHLQVQPRHQNRPPGHGPGSRGRQEPDLGREPVSRR